MLDIALVLPDLLLAAYVGSDKIKRYFMRDKTRYKTLNFVIIKCTSMPLYHIICRVMKLLIFTSI